MKPRPFAYCRPETTEEAVALLAEYGDEARVLAGGQSLIPMLNFRMMDTAVLIDISRIAALGYIRETGSGLEIGAAVTQAQLLAYPNLATAVPLLAQSLPFVGHVQTRNRGTVCGSLAHADPSSELPLALATLGGEMVLRSRRGGRTLPAHKFQLGLLTTAREADELIVAARFPFQNPAEGSAFGEVARRHGDFAVVSLAAVARGRSLRLGVGGVADRPTVRAFNGLSGTDLDEALNGFAWDLGGSDDLHATARYRRDIVRRLGRRILEEAQACSD